MEPSEFQAALNALRQEYERNLSTKIGEIESNWRALTLGEWNADTFKTMVRNAHSLAGSGATYGFVHVSTASRAFEQFAKRLNAEQLPDPTEHETIELLLEQLRNSTTALPHMMEDEETETEDSPLLYHTTAVANLWLYEPDNDLAGEIETQLAYFGYRVMVSDCLQDFGPDHSELPGALLLDWDMAQEKFGERERARLEQMRQLEYIPPILFFASRDDLSARLEAVRAGATAYLVKPLVMTTLIETLDAHLGNHSGDPYRILIVDDDVELAQYYSMTLEGAGMMTQVVMDPLDVMSPLVEFHPDLILTDMYMPNMSGLELASILRQQEAYVSIPIVFLSAETDADKQHSAMLRGGDDFLLKPIESDHLVRSVVRRVKRARVLRSLAERDSLTGLLNHTRFREQLVIEVARAIRTRTNLSLIMLDIDNFKSVNDMFGHPTGDRVIKSLARLMKQRLRKSDILGRYGGEEFAVILPETNGSAAWKVMEEIRESFAQISHQSSGIEFHVTVSGGIATVPPARDAAALNSTADRALYQAKRNGRNQIEYGVE